MRLTSFEYSQPQLAIIFVREEPIKQLDFIIVAAIPLTQLSLKQGWAEAMGRRCKRYCLF
jgi:hypothetical protein